MLADKGESDLLFRLYIEGEGVRVPDIYGLENTPGRLIVDQVYPGAFCAGFLSGPNIERNSAPAGIVYLELECQEGFGQRVLGYSLLVPVACVLAAY